MREEPYGENEIVQEKRLLDPKDIEFQEIDDQSCHKNSLGSVQPASPFHNFSNFVVSLAFSIETIIFSYCVETFSNRKLPFDGIIPCNNASFIHGIIQINVNLFI